MAHPTIARFDRAPLAKATPLSRTHPGPCTIRPVVRRPPMLAVHGCRRTQRLLVPCAQSGWRGGPCSHQRDADGGHLEHRVQVSEFAVVIRDRGGPRLALCGCEICVQRLGECVRRFSAADGRRAHASAQSTSCRFIQNALYTRKGACSMTSSTGSCAGSVATETSSRRTRRSGLRIRSAQEVNVWHRGRFCDVDDTGARARGDGRTPGIQGWRFGLTSERRAVADVSSRC